MKAESHNLADIPELRDLTTLQTQMQKPGMRVNVDGSFELGWGTMLLCAGLVPYFNAAMPKAFWSSPWLSWMAYLPLLCMAFAPFAIPKLIKRFITWPRTGYFANPNDLKLKQLLMLMAFGLALGFALSLPFILVAEIRELLNQSSPPNPMRSPVRHAIELLVCVIVAVYLGRKVIRKRQPPPGAYDAAVLAQSTLGRKRLRQVKFVLLLIFAGVPVLLCGLVFGVIYLSKSVMSHTEIHWSHLGVLSFFLATNAILYLMGNGVTIRQHRWKWLVLVLLLFGPLIAAPAIPYPPIKPELVPMLDLLPPAATLFLGLMWFLSGAATLILFIRHNPLPESEAP